MELMLVITLLCFCLSLLISPCVSLEIQVQPSLDKVMNEVQLISVSTLPRKLRFTTEVTVKGHEETVSDNKQEVAHDLCRFNLSCTGKEKKKEEKVMVHGSKGTWQEWLERTETSEYFTMDYSHVKRRRPIHNKSLPLAP
ncbi:hypothetical protein JRO89_XS05G0022300 [Xanthoceras sorbifolium]|uniref:Uncharacterized protein n=1 Tax=Xanthoceras sorbifolium TaxID=99658 RepID=A0ABQ8I007_9ROSI|nr:hypothetical protein JRO89_XS05G0022300 [Xanthoceras sorbifolium]